MPFCPICNVEIDYSNKSEIGTCLNCADPAIQKIDNLSKQLKKSLLKASSSDISKVSSDNMIIARDLFQEIEELHIKGVKAFKYSEGLEREIHRHEQKILLKEVAKIYLELQHNLPTLSTPQLQNHATEKSIAKIHGLFHDVSLPYPRKVNRILKQLSLFSKRLVIKEILQEANILKDNDEVKEAVEKYKEALFAILEDETNSMQLNTKIDTIRDEIIALGDDPDILPLEIYQHNKLIPPVKNTTPINQSLPFDNLVAFDCKTTGVDPGLDRIIEFGLSKFMIDGKWDAQVETYSNPGFPIPGAANAYNKITDRMVASSPPPHKIIKNIVRWVGPEAIFFMHYANLYTDFLVLTLGMANIEIPKGWYVVDTMKWAKERIKSADHQLETMIRELNLPIPENRGALGEAKAVALLYSKLVLDNKFILEDLSSHSVRMFSMGEKAITNQQKIHLLRLGADINVFSDITLFQAGKIISKL